MPKSKIGEPLILFLAIAALCHLSGGMIRNVLAAGRNDRACSWNLGGIVRGPEAEKKIALIFTGGDFADGGDFIRSVLGQKNAVASFFFTGDFYRLPSNEKLIMGLISDGHYLGPHSDKHLLYCSWEDRELLLVQKREFVSDMENNFREMEKFGLDRAAARYFVPPYEWYNETIAAWAREKGLVLINFTSGTGSNADYTTPTMPGYRSSERILSDILEYEKSDPKGLNGFLLLLHIGTHPDRVDKFYHRLEELIDLLSSLGYTFLRVDELLAGCGS